jgi:RNA polymerase sigma factor (sigma-70 family)
MASRSHDSQLEKSRGEVLDELLRSEHRRLLRQARHHTPSDHDAEEALADAFVQFLRFYDGPSGEDALHWLLLVVKRCAWQQRRRGSWKNEVLTDDPGKVAYPSPDEQGDPAALAERREDALYLADLISRLKPVERRALMLLGLGYSYREIAELSGWSVRKVDRCISEGRAAVRKSMEGG